MKTPFVALAFATLALGGCVSVLPTPTIPSALISLPAERANAPADPLQADVAVYLPESSRAFAGSDIAVRDNQELIYLSDVRWSDIAPALLQGALVNSLTKASGPGKAVPGQLGPDRLRRALAGHRTLGWQEHVAGSRRGSGDADGFGHAPHDRAAEFPVGRRSGRSRPSRARAALALVAQKLADDVAAFVAKTVTAKPAKPQ